MVRPALRATRHIRGVPTDGPNRAQARHGLTDAVNDVRVATIKDAALDRWTLSVTLQLQSSSPHAARQLRTPEMSNALVANRLSCMQVQIAAAAADMAAAHAPTRARSAILKMMTMSTTSSSDERYAKL